LAHPSSRERSEETYVSDAKRVEDQESVATADLLLAFAYGVVTSLASLATVAVALTLIVYDLAASAQASFEIFECGLAGSEWPTTELNDLRPVLAIAVLFEIEYWALLVYGLELVSRQRVVVLLLFIFNVYSLIELFLIV
jgi:hypothetical protein